MRYATLAILLLLGMFGMSAPVVAEVNQLPVVTVDVTGEANPSDAANSFYVDAAVSGVSNYTYNVIVKVGGVVQHNKNYLGSGASIHRFIDATPWGTYVNGNSIEYKVTISGVFDTFATTIGP